MKVRNLAIVGLQWGDEGKGKIIDLLARDFDLVVRYQGGPNAGHTVRRQNEKIIFHQLPSGILHPGVQNLIAAGCVINPETLFSEIDTLDSLAVNWSGRLWISKFAHVIIPHHILIDTLREEGKARPIGTTRRGVGVCYEDKLARIGVRISDLIDEDRLSDRLKSLISYKNFLIIDIYSGEPIEDRKIINQYLEYGERLKPLVVVDPYFLRDFQSKRILFEGAQGTLLDINFGTYPYVTSSHPIGGGITASLGYMPERLEVVGIVKAYTTRVGLGPFPTEIKDELGDKIREMGNEFGSTTGRPRRCGWIDLSAIRYGAIINGVKRVILTKLDVLSNLEEINIGIGYQGRDDRYDPTVENLIPVYKKLSGWREDIADKRKYEDLPSNARHYIETIEEITSLKVIGISVGPEPEQMIWQEEV